MIDNKYKGKGGRSKQLTKVAYNISRIYRGTVEQSHRRNDDCQRLLSGHGSAKKKNKNSNEEGKMEGGRFLKTGNRFQEFL